MYQALRHVFLAGILFFSSTLLCQEGREKEKIDPACRANTSQNTNPFAPDFNPDTYETWVLEDDGTESTNEDTAPANGFGRESNIQIMKELANLFGNHDLDPDKAIRFAECLKPHMKTLAVVALCRLSEKRALNRSLVEQLVKLSRTKDLRMALSLLSPGFRNEYIIQEMNKKILNAPRIDGSIIEEDPVALFNPEDLSVLAVAALNILGNMEEPDLEKVEILIDQADWHDLQIALAINIYTNDDVKLMMMKKVFKKGLAQAKKTYVAESTFKKEIEASRQAEARHETEINTLSETVSTFKKEIETSRQAEARHETEISTLCETESRSEKEIEILKAKFNNLRNAFLSGVLSGMSFYKIICLGNITSLAPITTKCIALGSLGTFLGSVPATFIFLYLVLR